MMASPCEVSVVVPAYREEPGIARALEAIAGQCRLFAPAFEIVVVDDGSPDETWCEVRAAAALIGELRAVRLSRNFGKEAAVFAGLEEARGAAVVVMDADLQHPPEVLREFHALWKAGGIDVVEGVKRRREREPALRRLTSRLFNQAISWLTGEDFRGNSDFKLLDRRVVDALLAMPERRSFFRGMVGWLGFRHCRVEFDVAPRPGGGSRWSVPALMGLAGKAVVSYSTVPLRLIHLAAAGFLGMALLLGARSSWLYVTGQAIGGFMTVILLLLILGALVLMSLGVIAEYLGAIYEEVKARPRYLVAERLDAAPPTAKQLASMAEALAGSQAAERESAPAARAG